MPGAVRAADDADDKTHFLQSVWRLACPDVFKLAVEGKEQLRLVPWAFGPIVKRITYILIQRTSHKT
jgi:hypothetical protein